MTGMTFISTLNYLELRHYLYLVATPSCTFVRLMVLLFIPTAAVFIYIVTHIILSLKLHQDDMLCGINALNIKKSPSCRGTATPKVGKQK
jgi:hypothetical protein